VSDLFLTAGVDLPSSGSGAAAKSAARKPSRVALILPKVLESAIQKTVFNPSEQQRAAAEDYARIAKSPGFAKQKEVSVRDIFYTKILGQILGYTRYDPDNPYSLQIEKSIRAGAADAALGRFSDSDGSQVIAPLEMKAPSCGDLDAIVPGRAKSPVQQAWEYAMDSPGVSWVLVSNCIELRLYRFGRGRDAYESFDLRRLDDSEHLRRLMLLLGASRLLEGHTEALLIETDNALKSVTGDLYEQYKTLRDRLLAFVTSAAGGPRLPRRDAIEPVQKLLDRVLFIAFGSGAGLLPPRLLQQAATEQSAWRPMPLWDNFNQLFNFVDKGSGHPLNIWAYNGGLFAPDPVLDAIVLTDDLAKAVGELGNWDFGSEVPVTVLGRLFEQSITDLEKLRAEAEGKPSPGVGKVKKEGVVYTPDHIARFLVEHTIGTTLAERFSGLLAKHAAPEANGKPAAASLWPNAAAETSFWREYLGVLLDVTILDPACGSGAFLAAAFDVLAGEYARVLQRLAELGADTGLDAFDEILGRNLYGIDLNIESVEITRLSLWLKTARQKHRLASLDETVRDGNSLIADKAYTERPFLWDGRFADVARRGGFDVVIGNPPYVRMELLKDQKPYFTKNFGVADERTDLYAYFFEKGVGVLKPGGRLGYISSSTFFRTGSGANLRKLMSEETEIEAVIDFGDEQIFDGVTTYPAIITARKLPRGGTPAGELRFFNLKKLPHDLGSAFEAESQPMPRSRLGQSSWQFESDALSRLREKIAKGRKTLGEVYGAPLRGIVTGLNKAFILDTPTRDRLVARDPRSAELLKPFLKGEHIKRWRVEPEGLFLINIPKGKVNIEDYPAIRDHLLPFKAELEARATQQEWFELQQAQLAYQPMFEKPKIIYPHFQNSRMFSLDETGLFSNDKSYCIASDDLALLAYLNSSVAWCYLSGISPAVRNDWYELRVQYVERLPLALEKPSFPQELREFAAQCHHGASEIWSVHRAVADRISADFGSSKPLSSRLQSWHQLSFKEFRAEVKRAFKTEIPVRERAEWEAYLTEEAARINALTAQLAQAEAEINRLVYAAFDLTLEEIALLESSLQGQI